MKDFLNKLFHRGLSNDQKIIVILDQKIAALQEHVIALARLSFAKPERLVEEAKNTKSNAEYLEKMIEAAEKGKK